MGEWDLIPMEEFLIQLFETGELTVARRVEHDRRKTEPLLREAERVWRLNWPYRAPQFRMDVAQSAADVLLQLCQAFVYRDLDIPQVTEQLSKIPLTHDQTPATHYSADLLLRFLPELYRHIQRASADDPLLAVVVEVAARWPLAAVGIPACQPMEPGDLFQDPGFEIVLADRIAAAEDFSDHPAEKRRR